MIGLGYLSASSSLSIERNPTHWTELVFLLQVSAPGSVFVKWPVEGVEQRQVVATGVAARKSGWKAHNTHFTRTKGRARRSKKYKNAFVYFTHSQSACHKTLSRLKWRGCSTTIKRSAQQQEHDRQIINKWSTRARLWLIASVVNCNKLERQQGIKEWGGDVCCLAHCFCLQLQLSILFFCLRDLLCFMRISADSSLLNTCLNCCLT